MGSALLIVDVQNDFCPGGALAVREGDLVAPVLARLAEWFAAERLPVYASRDWHPPRTKHFRDQGGPWPPHCVAGTPGAAFHPRLSLPPSTIVVTKGDQPDSDGYSAFDGRLSSGATLADDLRHRRIDRLYVGGLATDYCVKASVLDALKAGFEVSVLTDAIRAVETQPGDEARAVEEMKAAGAAFISSRDLA